MIIIDVVSVLL